MSDRARFVVAGAISLSLIGLLLWVAGIGSVNLRAIRPEYFVGAVIAYTAVVILRGATFKLFAPESRDTNALSWTKLASQHQLVFLTAPSGSGDLAFPHLARRCTGLSLGAGVRMIAEIRIRDIVIVLGLGCAGLVGAKVLPPFALGGTAVACVALVFMDRATAVLARLLGLVRGKKVPPAAEAPPIMKSARTRVALVLLPIALWIIASAGILAGFAAAGHSLTIFEAWVMLAGLNIAGAIAVSIAGLGIAEAGAAGVLALLGVPLSEAAAVALVARPLLLLSTVTACGVVLGVSLWLDRAA